MTLGLLLEQEDASLDRLSDLELLHRYAERNDGEAFRALVRRHHVMVRSACLSVLRDHALAEDAVQDTFVALSQRPQAVKESLGGYLRGCATACALMVLRSERRRRVRQGRWASWQPLEVRDEDQQPENWREVVDLILARLPVDDRELVVRYYLHGETMLRIGRSMGVEASTVKRRLDRITGQLRLKMKTTGGRAILGVVLAWVLPMPVVLYSYGLVFRRRVLPGWRAVLGGAALGIF